MYLVPASAVMTQRSQLRGGRLRGPRGLSALPVSYTGFQSAQATLNNLRTTIASNPQTAWAAAYIPTSIQLPAGVKYPIAPSQPVATPIVRTAPAPVSAPAPSAAPAPAPIAPVAPAPVSTRTPKPVSTAINPSGGPPSTITDYDAYGNPIYAVPPPGQSIVGYDQAGTPLYGSVPAGYAATGQMRKGLPVYGFSNQPPPAGYVVAGYDASGNPIYAPVGSGVVTSSGGGLAPSVSVSTTPTPTESAYQSVLDWLSQQTLISGVPNWGIVAAAGLAVVYLQNRKGRR